MNTLDTFLFGLYPYICLTVFLLGSLIRFDRDQYTWKSDSSQLLKVGQLRWGSNLFHIGVLFLFFGHFFGAWRDGPVGLVTAIYAGLYTFLKYFKAWCRSRRVPL